MHHYCPFVTQSIVKKILDITDIKTYYITIFIDVSVGLLNHGYHFNQLANGFNLTNYWLTGYFSANKLIEAGDMEEVNEIDVEETLHQIQNNDSSLTHCIFNNVVCIMFLVLYSSL